MNRTASMLGLAMKAGKVQSGLFLTEEAIRSGKARLVIMAEDAEANTAKTLKNKCGTRQVPLRSFGSKESLGHCIGKEYRSCAAVTDEGFAEKLLQLLDETEDVDM